MCFEAPFIGALPVSVLSERGMDPPPLPVGAHGGPVACGLGGGGGGGCPVVAHHHLGTLGVPPPPSSLSLHVQCMRHGES